MTVPWLDARGYYTRRWGQPLGRVGVDGGFSCPNRGSNRQTPGCTFCSAVGNRAPYQGVSTDLADQVSAGIAFQRSRYGVSLFGLYFQSFSSTWAPVATLKKIYDQGLDNGPFVELTVGTRPDCVPDDVADLLASYQRQDREVWVELGLQSSNDETLRRTNRGHDLGSYHEAAGRLASRGIRFTTHVMFGLPGEGKLQFLDTVRVALAAGTSGLKFHDLLLVPGTRLHEDWRAGLVGPVDPENYLDAVADALVLLPPEVVVWRVQSDPEDRKSPPLPGTKWPKNRFLGALATEVSKRRTSRSSQGA